MGTLVAEICLCVRHTVLTSLLPPPHSINVVETIYQAFDYIAKKRRIFKVETVGDCYVGKGRQS